MRKPDDDLKIDISELFGGDLPSPSETLEESIPPTESAASEAVETAPAKAESQFQEWMTTRNAELEAKSLELERKFQESSSQPHSPEPDETFSGSELLAAQTELEAPPKSGSNSPIDFNAPIAPPFMGVSAPPPAPTAEVPSNPEAVAAEPPPQNAEELKRIQAEYEFLMLYDEFRNIIVYELKDLVGEKKTYTMLGRTVELAREKYPEIFRNANWDSAGNLLEDGAVDSQRIIENKNMVDPQKADAMVDSALSTLLRLRLQAVEKGLGTGLKNKVCAHMYQWISEKTQRTGREGKDTSILKRLSSYVAST